MVRSDTSVSTHGSFTNPFHIDDLQVFDDDSIRNLLEHHSYDWTCTTLARSLHGAPKPLVQRIARCLPTSYRRSFLQHTQSVLPSSEVEQAQQEILDDLFWELIYWKTPDLYEELTEGERLHPDIFRSLESDLRGKVVADVGAGSGRATFECAQYGAEKIYAIEPSPGLQRLLQDKIRQNNKQDIVIPKSGRFDHLPLLNQSVDTVISCSAFTAQDDQGGEPGLAELKRVIRPGGKIIIIWPRRADHKWLKEHHFNYVSLPVQGEMHVRFRSWQTALNCARLFYAQNTALRRYLMSRRKPEIPFSIIGMNPPCDYFWLQL